jgi:hypothetical protein
MVDGEDDIEITGQQTRQQADSSKMQVSESEWVEPKSEYEIQGLADRIGHLNN